ncbi:GDSL-type esterase/lipase family protein [Streptomyces spiramenti]|uniref:SGNH/GDSL hydrolase family protein n=1 Tax=Streptomyces spiramenti TaxID=2720606 RepID=A0ABX1AQS4_9ACTN|nr:GDSL-type esterase/lipase family protein [Streptomyces spiramenti]NJP66797.1 SGNH/GDSL hydrolase family protein [Streptomyces spiramenti]
MREGDTIDETSDPVPSAAGEADDPGCLRPGEARRLLARAPWRRLVVIGDIPVERSAEPLAGYGPWPWYDRVAAALREATAGLAYLNLLGRRQATAAQVRSAQLPAALAFRGDLALLCWGSGYVARETSDLRGPTAELTRTVAPLRDAGYDVALIGLGPAAVRPGPAGRREQGAEQQRRMGDRARAVAVRHGTLCVDLDPPTAESGQLPAWSGDRSRRTGRGHAVAAATVVRALAAALPAPTPGHRHGQLRPG